MSFTQDYLATLKTKLSQGSYIPIAFTKEWLENFPTAAGVYVIQHNGALVYVGETGSLRGRMKDLLDTRTHTLRRTLGERLHHEDPDYEAATASRKFPERIEQALNEYMTRELSIACLPVELGRKELEEFIEKDLNPETRLNKKGKRIERK